MAQSKTQKKKIKDSLVDKPLQTALERSVGAYKIARAKAMDGFDLNSAQNKVRAIKERCIENMEDLFAEFKAAAEDVGAVVYEAKDAQAACDIVTQIAKDRGVKHIVKSKSMLTEEIELNANLIKNGLEVVETDLGEWIIQLAGEKPSHFTAPAMHKTREQVAELFSKVTGEKLEPDVAKLVEVARKQLRQAFIDADMGISGANIAIAETGTLVIVANEGNDRLVTTLPPIHVAIVGLEKLVSNIDDATEILKVLSKSATGQKQTAYVSFITGPSRTTDIEKTLALGVHGPKELHIIFVDAGRKELALDNECKESLYCIKCGACLNMCPVFKTIGGHAFANSYIGGIGAVLTAHLQNLDAAEDTLNLCTSCSYCKSICPSKINIPDMVLELRKRLVEKNGLSIPSKTMLAALRRPRVFQSAVRIAKMFQKPFVNEDGMLKNLPFASSYTSGRQFPGFSEKSLRDILPKYQAGSSNITVSFFAGCMIDFIYPHIGEAIWKVLTKSNVTIHLPEMQSCCGAPAVYIGDTDTAKKLAMDNILAIEENNPHYVVTGCPTCAVMIKEQFPKLLANTEWETRAESLSVKVMDFAQFAVDILKIDLNNTESGSITYHDPCHQVRGLGSSACSRQLIMESGKELIEMEDSDECCGFAGSYSIKQSAISNAILKRKIKNINQTGAETVATDCPGCIMQIKGGLAKNNLHTNVCHTAEIIAKLLD